MQFKFLINIIIVLFCYFWHGAKGQDARVYPVQLSDSREFGGRVNSIFQDKLGFIWVGMETGLFRYDGTELKAFRYDPANPLSIASNNILTITSDSVGNLWIGTKGGGLNYYNQKNGQFTRYLHNEKDTESISYNEVYSIVPGSKGNLWIGTDGGGLNYFNPKTGKFKHIKADANAADGLQSNKILRIVQTGGGKYWIGTWGGGVHLLDPATGNIKHLGKGTQYAKANVYNILQVSDGIYWLATWKHGLVAYHSKSDRFYTIIHPSVIPYFRDLQMGANGSVWVGSGIGLLHFSSPGSGYSLVEGVLGNFGNVSKVFVDNTNTVWAGCENGTIGKVNSIRKKFSIITQNSPFNELPVNSVIVQKGKGQIYFASGGKLVHYNPSSRRFKSYLPPLPDIVSIVEMHDNHTLLCATLTGLCIFDTHKQMFTKLQFERDTATDLLTRQIWVVSALGTEYWVGALGVAYQIAYQSKTKLWRVLKTLYNGAEGGLSVSHYPACFLADAQQNFWVGTWGGGVNVQKNGSDKFTYLMHDAANDLSLSDNFVECLLSDHAGNILIGTHAGLNRLNTKTSALRNFSVSNGLASDWIASVGLDSKNRIWAGTQKGISAIGNDGATIKNYDFNDGLPANSFLPRSIAQDTAGNFYFGSVRGLVKFHPDSILDNPYLAKPVLVDFKINDERVTVSASSPLKQNIELTREIYLDYSKSSSFSFQMAALGYFNPAKNRIKYRLTGYDKSWKITGAGKTAVYSGIPWGTYTFTFLASNEDGVWNPSESSIRIVIGKPWWFSNFALAGYVLLVLGSIVVFLQIRKKPPQLPPAVPDEPMRKTPNHSLIQPGPVEIEPAEKQFLQRALAVVEQNIADPDFGVEELCFKMCISRPQLYRKISAITGVTVTEFIKEIRLKRAAQLLEQRPESISEIAYKVGFNDPKYFSKCFKQHFGVSPAGYAENHQKGISP